jgi:hypothetical protein
MLVVRCYCVFLESPGIEKLLVEPGFLFTNPNTNFKKIIIRKNTIEPTIT